MITRREAMGAIAYPVAFAAMGSKASACSRFGGALASAFALTPPAGRTPEQLAGDETFWFQAQQAFTVDRSIVNLNNGGVCPAPSIVQESQRRHLADAHSCPPHVLWQVQEPQLEGVRAQLAREFGADPEEIAITRNASESLQACQFGFDLKPGDEVLTTTHDYPRMISTFQQRARREGILLRQFDLPVPLSDPQEVVALFEQNITPKTRLILMCHMVNLTGQIMPVKEVVAMARARGVPVIVDGAHALAHFEFKLSELECDYYGASLHKWLFAPLGTGLLYVRRSLVKDLWPLMAAEEKHTDDIRKFEQTGTRPAAGYLAIAEAIQFHRGLGPANKQARLVHLRDYWISRLKAHDRVRLLTNVSAGQACAIATVHIDGLDSAGVDQLALGQAAHPGDDNRPRQVQRHPHLALRLYHAR